MVLVNCILQMVADIRVNSEQEHLKVKELITLVKIVITRDYFHRVYSQVQVYQYIKMVIFTKDNLKKVKEMDMANISKNKAEQ